jgi:hypothetical protein
MRSALDHLAFALVERNPRVDSICPEWREYCQFPTRTKLPKNCTPPLSKRHFSNDLPGISDKAFTLIELMQPYYEKGGVNNALRFLDHLSKIDKHRHFYLVRPRTRKHESARFRSGLSSRGHEALDRGAIIYPSHGWNEADRPLYVKRSYRTFVAFDKRHKLGEAVDLSVDHLLQLILEQIRTELVPVFEKILN